LITLALPRPNRRRPPSSCTYWGPPRATIRCLRLTKPSLRQTAPASASASFRVSAMRTTGS